jgi:glycopeptide antibiotics resistance protein
VIETKVYTLGAIGVIPSIVYWVLLVVLVVGVAFILFSQETRRLQKIAKLLLLEWCWVVFSSAVFFRETKPENAIVLVPLSSYFCITENSYFLEAMVINILNIIMFVPIGLLLRMSSHNWKGVVLVGGLISVAIEVTQFVLRRGLCEIDDVIHNVLGCMVGYAIATLALTLTFFKKTRVHR